MSEQQQQHRDALQLDTDTMRRIGYQVIDLLVNQLTTLDEDVAWKGASRRELEPLLREPAPEHGRHFDELLVRLREQVLDYRARVDHPRFFAFIPAAPTWPGILGDLIANGSTVFAGSWLGGAGASMLELVVLDWFREWLGMSEPAGGLLLSGGSAANLTALACARLNRAPEERDRGVVYYSEQAHSSIERAAHVLGFTPDRVRAIPVDAEFRLDLNQLRAAIEQDLARGLVPLAIGANGGATSTGAIDPLDEVADLAREYNCWLHIDAAYGGFAVLTERGRHALRGIERADSVTLDPHKWLYQPYEAGCVIVKDQQLLERAFHVMHDYMRDTEVHDREVNFGERGIQLTRSARAIKIWLSIQSFGVTAFRAAIDRCLDHATYIADRVRGNPQFELLAPPSLGIVCFRRLAASGIEADHDALNEQLLQHVVSSGRAMMSSTRLQGRYALRLCVLNHATTRDDVALVMDMLEHGGV